MTSPHLNLAIYEYFFRQYEIEMLDMISKRIDILHSMEQKEFDEKSMVLFNSITKETNTLRECLAYMSELKDAYIKTSVWLCDSRGSEILPLQLENHHLKSINKTFQNFISYRVDGL